MQRANQRLIITALKSMGINTSISGKKYGNAQAKAAPTPGPSLCMCSPASLANSEPRHSHMNSNPAAELAIGVI